VDKPGTCRANGNQQRTAHNSRTTRSPRGSPRSVPSRRYPATRRWPRLLLAIGEVRDLEGNGLWLLRDVHYNVIADEVQDLSIG